ncbi:A/G-specific adenine glycosylase [Salinibacterium xinjiangense]|uniref:A/G-specific adenine glycosylase n=1 Tax=Salinibacterium xinjiangense TaxID=386302 RepID=UPI001984A15C|nr:A/G-specific adenine glycosylase [Salinibacterium xinjiangense]GGL01953.1 A/G-specific adenine glycosylase [Salinibacterium xinjiangense]
MEIAVTVNDWFVENQRDLPWRREGFGAWGILVSEVMLQQTPVVRVIPRLEQWLERWPTPAALAASPPGEAVRAWDRLGYPRRALRLHAAATAITEVHGGVVPSDVAQLLELPGIGDYTARAVAAFAFGLRHPVVDTNVRRVVARAILGQGEAAPASTRRDLAAMEALLPHDEPAAKVFNAGMMELGALVCTARAPRCGDCPLAGSCAWRAAGYPEYDGPRSAVQAKFEGSDRQVRGLVMAELRASDIPVTRAEIERLWPDATQLARALASLETDGLVVADDSDAYLLP